MTSRHRLVLVGIEHYHSTGWAWSLEAFAGRVEVVGTYDPDPSMGERLAPRYHDPSLAAALPSSFRRAPFHASLDDLLGSSSPDLALVTLPNRDAPAAITRLAGAGVHMLVDKPGAKTADDARPAFAAARAAGVRVSTGLGRRFALGWPAARDIVASGAIGRVMTAEALLVSSSVAVRGAGNPLFDRDLSGHGVLGWLGIHDVDALTWITGERIVEVQAMTGRASGDRAGVEDVASVAFGLSGGAIGSMHVAYALPRPGNEGHVAVRGTRGSVVVDVEGNLRWERAGDAADPVLSETRRYEVPPTPGYGVVGLRVIEDWLEAVEQGRDPLATGEDLVRALEVIDASYESAATGRRVAVPGRAVAGTPRTAIRQGSGGGLRAARDR